MTSKNILSGIGIRAKLATITVLFLMFILSACATVPNDAIELSNTVGRDLEEVHRSHRALANLFFDRMEEDINKFIDEIYAPAYIKYFATDFELDKKIKGIVESTPNNLLPVMTKFVEISVRDIEAKRSELLAPVKAQRKTVIEEIDTSHRRVQAAQAIIAGHLASVRKVHDAQNEILKAVGLEGAREDIAQRTSELSGRMAGLLKDAKKAEGNMDKVEEVFIKIRDAMK